MPEVYNGPQFQTSNLGVQEAAGTDASVYLDPISGPMPVKPTAGVHLVPLEMVCACVFTLLRDIDTSQLG